MKKVKYLIVIILVILYKIFHGPLNINYSKSEITEHLNKWKKMNTGTYVYVYQLAAPHLSFVQNNTVIQYMFFQADMNLNGLSKHMYSCRGETRLNSLSDLYIDRSFETLEEYSNNMTYNRYEAYISFDKKYGFISKIEFTSHKNLHNILFNPFKLRFYERIDPEYTYGLLMLPPKTKFTPEVTKKILDKYRRAIACADTPNRDNNYQYTVRALIFLKDNPECIKKHLTWEDTGK